MFNFPNNSFSKPPASHVVIPENIEAVPITSNPPIEVVTPKIIKIENESLSAFYNKELRPGSDRSPSFYRVSGTGVICDTKEYCLEMHSYYMGLKHKGKFGRLLHNFMTKDFQDKKLILLGISGKIIRDTTGGIYYPSPLSLGISNVNWVKDEGTIVEHLISIPLEKEYFSKLLTFNHEASHYGIQNIKGDTDPVYEMSEAAQNKFLDRYFKAAVKSKTNPFPINSLDWHAYNDASLKIFGAPWRYAECKRTTEIAAYALQYELASEGILSRYFEELAVGLEEVLNECHEYSLNHRISAKGTRFFLPENSPSYFSDFAQSMPVRTAPPQPLNSSLETFKSTLKNVMQKGLSKAWQAAKPILKVGGIAISAYGKAEFGIPLEFIIDLPNRDPSDPHAFEKAFATASGTWGLNIAKFNFLNKVNPALAIYIGVGETCAHFTPVGAFLERAQALPTDKEIDKMFEGKSTVDARLYKEEIDEIRNRYIEWEYTYDFFRSITSSNVIHKIGQKIGAYVDTLAYPRMDKLQKDNPTRPSMSSLPALEEIEQIIEQEALASFKKTHDELASRIQNINTILDAQKAFNNTQKDLAEYNRQWQEYKRSDVPENVSNPVSPQTKPNSLVSLFSPNLATLTPINTLPPFDNVQVTPETIQKCQLTWQASQSNGITYLKTSTSIPEEDISEIETQLNEVEKDEQIAVNEASSLSTYISTPSSSSSSLTGPTPPKKPTFGQLSKITDISVGGTPVGGLGVTFSLYSGAKISLSATETAVITGLTIPLTKGALLALGSGFLYAAPVAAALVGIQQLMKHHENKILKNLQSDNKHATKDLNKINNSVQSFGGFVDLFHAGAINKDDFLKKINEYSQRLQDGSKELRKKAHYAEKHQSEGKGIQSQYFDGQTKLRQMNLDLQLIAREAIIKKEVEEQYTPQLKKKELATLVTDLVALSDKKIISTREKYEQEALLREISDRTKTLTSVEALSKNTVVEEIKVGTVDAVHHENVEELKLRKVESLHIDPFVALNTLQTLVNKPAAISLNPQEVAQPNSISTRYFVGVGHHQNTYRRHDRTKAWANDLNYAYHEFRQAAQAGDINKMEQTAGTVNFHINRANGNGDVNLKNYALSGLQKPNSSRKHPQYYNNADEYYRGYINSINTHVTNTLNTARAAKASAATAEIKPIITQEELDHIKLSAAINTFNTALSNLRSKEQTGEPRDFEFDQLYTAAVALSAVHKGSEQEKQLIEETIRIKTHYGTYSRFLTSESENTKLSEATQAFNQALAKFREKEKTGENRDPEFEELYNAAKTLSTIHRGSEEEKQLIFNTIKIKDEYGTYSHYLTSEAESKELSEAILLFNSALVKFQEKEKLGEVRDNEFEELYRAAKILSKLHKGDAREKQLLDNTIKIREVHGTYSIYQAKEQRLIAISVHLNAYFNATKKMSDPQLKKGELADQYKIAHDESLLLMGLEIKEEDILTLSERGNANKGEESENPDVNKTAEEAKPSNVKINSAMIIQEITSTPESYKTYVKLGHYDNHVLPAFSSPIARITLHIINDIHRYEGYTLLKWGATAVTTASQVAPSVLPAAVNYLIGSYNKESAVVQGGLQSRISTALTRNVFITAYRQVSSYKDTLANASTLNKKTCVVQNVNTAVQIVSDVIIAGAKRTFGEENRAVNLVTASLSATSTAVSAVSNVLHYSTLFYKTSKYIHAGTFATKVHKVGQGLTGAVLSGFDFYEFMATEQADVDPSGHFKILIGDFLPQFRGNLPEYRSYYVMKDLLITAGCSAFAKDNSIMQGLTFYNSMSCVYNVCSDKYTEHVLCAIMTNCRFFFKQIASTERNQKLAASIKNLGYYLNDNCRIDKSETPVKLRAKLFYFECLIRASEEQEKWDEVIKITTPVRGDDNIYRFSQVNSDVFEGLNTLRRYFKAVLEKMCSRDTVTTTWVLDKVAVADKMIEYFSDKYLQLSLSEQEKVPHMPTFIEHLKEIKITVLTNYCILYVKKEVADTPWIALKVFDVIPKAQRDIHHWYMLGHIIEELKQTYEGTILFKMTALERFCFQNVFDGLTSKSDLNDYERELLSCSIRMLESLASTLKEPFQTLSVTLNTDSFVQVVEDIFAEENKIMAPHVKPKPQGLSNLGNTCFMNATLQLLLHNPLIVHSLKDTQARLFEKNKVKALLLVNALLELSSKELITHIDLMKFHSACIFAGLDWQLGRQEDAQELLGKILDYVAEGNEKFKLNLSRLQEKFKNELIKTKVLSETTNLILPLYFTEGTNNNTLTGMLEKEFAKTQVEDQFIRRQLRLKGDPEMLYIHFVRFKTVVDNQGATICQKDSSPVMLPKNGLVELTHFFTNPVSKMLYEIVGRINHVGDLNSGHYTADILKSQWHRCSDVQVTNGASLSWGQPDTEVYILCLRKLS